MIYLVDNTINGNGASPVEIRAALHRIRPGLEVVCEPFKEVSLERVRDLHPTHIILSGQSHPWDMYTKDSLAGVFEVIRQAPRPVLGLCGGHQQMALAFGARVDLMQRLAPGEGYEGARRERGFFAVHTTGEGLFAGLSSDAVFWHSHCDEVKELPNGFRRTATNTTCDIQAMEHESLPLFGVQFHPELFDDDHLDGRSVLESFLKS